MKLESIQSLIKIKVTTKLKILLKKLQKGKDTSKSWTLARILRRN